MLQIETFERGCSKSRVFFQENFYPLSWFGELYEWHGRHTFRRRRISRINEMIIRISVFLSLRVYCILVDTTLSFLHKYV